MLSDLEKSIQELLSQEPHWNCCFPCKNSGKCCIGADISVCEHEWNLIKQYVCGLPDHEKFLLSENIQSRNTCIFRTDTKCLIHEVRPENCRYTPFQAVITSDRELLYCMVSEDCSFQSIRKQLDSETASRIANTKFPVLQNFNSETKYLCLNQIYRPCGHEEKYHLVSEWLGLSPLPIRNPDLKRDLHVGEDHI